MKPSAYPKEFLRHLEWYPDMLKVEDRDTGKAIPFRLYDIQMQLEFLVWEAMEQKQFCPIVVLKARKEGVSTWVGGRFFRDALNFENRHSMIVSCDDASTRNCLNMVRRFHRYYPEELETQKDSVVSLALKKTGSDFNICTAGSRERTGRSFTINALHFSEFDFFSVPDTYRAVMQSTPNDYPVVAIIESTAQGPEGPMEKHWRMAVNGESGFTPVFFSCFDFEKYRRPLSFDDLLKYSERLWREKMKAKLLAMQENYRGGKSADRREGFVDADRREGFVDGIREDGSGVIPETVGSGSDGGAETDGGSGSGSPDSPPDGTQETGDNPGGPLEEPGAGRGNGLRIPASRWEGAPRAADGSIDRRWRKAASDRVRLERAAVKSRKIKRAAHKIAPGKVSEKQLVEAFEDSMTPYEIGLRTEFGEERVPLEAINFIRWIKAAKCEGDEPTRRREYPCRPEESFEYSAETVLDPVILGVWTKEAHLLSPKRVQFSVVEDRRGKIECTMTEDSAGRILIYEDPVEGREYAMGVDPSTGGLSEKHDDCVACVLDVLSGNQVAEFRAKMDMDLAIDQIEGLGLHYNKAYTGVEANSYGIPFARSLEDRATLPMYERELHDRKDPLKLVKKIGWVTGSNTRGIIFTEMKKMVREERCKIRSLATLSECKTLVVSRSEESRVERIEARSGCHDDGVMAYGIAIMMRNRCLSPDQVVDEEPIKEEDINTVVRRMMNASGLRPTPRSSWRLPIELHTKHVKGPQTTVDGRRNVL
jgi:hypothetical protein